MGLRTVTLGLLGVLAALVALLVLLTGVRVIVGDDGEDDRSPSASARVATQRTVDVRLAAPGGDIDRLHDGEVRLVELRGIPGGAPVTVRQCSASRTDCDAWIPVVADDTGRAVFLFEFRSRVGTHEASCEDEPCALLVRDDTNRTIVAGRLFFGERASALDSVATRRATDPLFGVARDARPGTGQVVLGLGAAGILAGVAVALQRRGSWRPPEGDAFEGVELDLDPFAGVDLETWPDPMLAER